MKAADAVLREADPWTLGTFKTDKEAARQTML